MSWDKSTLRREIAEMKKKFTAEELLSFSAQVMFHLSTVDLFENAITILVYHSLPGEVDTHRLLRDYSGKKRFLLPVVSGDDLLLKDFGQGAGLTQVGYGIWEPPAYAPEFTDYDDIDLVIVPGVAFDRKMNRLGRGKGYYDRLLPQIKAPKIGICFDFQFFDDIPSDDNDVRMDGLVMQSRRIGLR